MTDEAERPLRLVHDVGRDDGDRYRAVPADRPDEEGQATPPPKALNRRDRACVDYFTYCQSVQRELLDNRDRISEALSKWVGVCALGAAGLVVAYSSETMWVVMASSLAVGAALGYVTQGVGQQVRQLRRRSRSIHEVLALYEGRARSLTEKGTAEDDWF